VNLNPAAKEKRENKLVVWCGVAGGCAARQCVYNSRSEYGFTGSATDEKEHTKKTDATDLVWEPLLASAAASRGWLQTCTQACTRPLCRRTNCTSGAGTLGATIRACRCLVEATAQGKHRTSADPCRP
jgi:hypothetical protein